jgi:radical SAM superfamily enzyme YgiQ (UPF0313 family)
VLAFPSTYSVGLTSLGFQVVWATLARRADVDVRRLFTDQGDPPHGGQRGRGPDLDLFGLSLSWELDGPVLLDLLEQQRIPLWAAERGDHDPIVFGGGPVLTANPEPLAPFFDAVLLGDGELLLPAFLDALQDCRTAPRAQRLRSLAMREASMKEEAYAMLEIVTAVVEHLEDAGDEMSTALGAHQRGRRSYKGGGGMAGLAQAGILQAQQHRNRL